MISIKNLFRSRLFYIVLCCITVAILAAIILFDLAFVNVEEEVPADPAPFKLGCGIAEVIHDFTFGISFSYHGEVSEIEVNKYTVEQLLKKEKIVLEEQDILNVDLQTVLEPGMLVQIDKVRFETEYKEVVLPFDRVVKTSSEYPEGTKVTISQGSKGLRKDTYSTKFVNDVLVEKKLVSQDVLQEPVDEVITCGTRPFQPEVETVTNTVTAG